jgi:hypothetical protein
MTTSNTIAAIDKIVSKTNCDIINSPYFNGSILSKGLCLTALFHAALIHL